MKWIQQNTLGFATIWLKWKTDFRDRLNKVFGNNRVVALDHNIEFPPRSPDLTPRDFFLWGYLKNKVFSISPQDIDILRQRMTDAFDK